MKKVVIPFVVAIAIILIVQSQICAQSEESGDIAIVVPVESLRDVIEDLLPYEFDFGKGFAGSFRVEAIENLKIIEDSISCSSYIVGKDVYYTIKIMDRKARVAVGNVRLRSNWELLVRYDETKRVLMVTPSVRGVIDKDSVSKGEMLLNAVLEGLSGLAYPVRLDTLKPIETALHKRDLSIDINITGVSVETGRIVVTMRPSAQYAEPNASPKQ